MALLAIIKPNILSNIRELLYFLAATHLCKQPLNHPNIVQIVIPIIKLGFNKLDFLIYKTGLIQKTMVFVNKINNTMIMTAYLCLLLLLKE